jgi:hypothetical protein
VEFQQCQYGKSLSKVFSCLFFLSFTDICRDSSDDDQSDGSSQTEGYAVMDLIEFEVPSDSESEGNASTESSGTDVSLADFDSCQRTRANPEISSFRLGLCAGSSGIRVPWI